jgi:hypothetical protein
MLRTPLDIPIAKTGNHSKHRNDTDLGTNAPVDIRSAKIFLWVEDQPVKHLFNRTQWISETPNKMVNRDLSRARFHHQHAVHRQGVSRKRADERVPSRFLRGSKLNRKPRARIHHIGVRQNIL